MAWKAHKYSTLTDPRWPDCGFEGFVTDAGGEGQLICECVRYEHAVEIATAHNAVLAGANDTEREDGK